MAQGLGEATTTSFVRLEAARCGCTLWRNNSGVAPPHQLGGRPVRYGLANDSPKLNKEIKSSDLIGITPVTVTPDMVGRVIGVFTAVEMKEEGWKFNQSEEREVAQKKFHDIVKTNGGFAGFASCIEDFRRIIGYEKR